MTFDPNISHAAVTVTLLRPCSKVKVISQGSRSQEENVAKAVGTTTSSEGFLIWVSELSIFSQELANVSS